MSRLADKLTTALLLNSALRHGMFTPSRFARIVKGIILDILADYNPSLDELPVMGDAREGYPQEMGTYNVMMYSGEWKKSHFAMMNFEGESKWSIEDDEGGTVIFWIEKKKG
jgi:hypothetical protein